MKCFSFDSIFKYRNTLPFLAIPLIVGCFYSFYYCSVNAAPGETGLAAIGLIQTGTISNPYLLPTGPTAHVSPIHVGLVALIYDAFGINSAASRIALSLASLAAYLLSAAALLRCCARENFGWLPRLVAILFTCLLPYQLFLTIIVDRQWDQPYGALILMVALMISIDKALPSRPALRPEVELAILAGITGLVSPAVLPSVCLALALSIRKRASAQNWRLASLLSVVIVAAFLVPWGLRNKIELGSVVLTRSNFGLELAAGNQDGATGASGTPGQYPHDSEVAARHLAAVGEVAYMAEMRRTAMDWIAAHPAGFARLTLARLRLLLLPPTSSGGWTPLLGAAVGTALVALFAIAKLAAILVKIWRRERVWLWLIFCFLPLAPYVVTHVNERYEFPVFFTSVLLICSSLEQMIAGVRGHSRPAAG